MNTEVTVSRKIKHSKKPSRKRFNINFIFFWAALIIHGIITQSVVYTLVFFVLSIIFTSWLFRYDGIFMTFIIYYLLEPVSLFLWVMLAVPFINIDPKILNFILPAFVPIFSILKTIYKRKDDDFLIKAKVALELYNTMFIIITGVIGIIAYSKNFDFLKPLVKMDELIQNGNEPRDIYNYLSIYMTLPFLISGASCRFILEYLEYRKRTSIHS